MGRGDPGEGQSTDLVQGGFQRRRVSHQHRRDGSVGLVRNPPENKPGTTDLTDGMAETDPLHSSNPSNVHGTLARFSTVFHEIASGRNGGSRPTSDDLFHVKQRCVWRGSNAGCLRESAEVYPVMHL